jgi:hypothetical protein
MRSRSGSAISVLANGARLEIFDISDRQLEGIRYMVANQEQGGLIRLQCRDFACRLLG